jgi:hypothetical protein
LEGFTNLEYLIIGTKLLGYMRGTEFPPSVRQLELVDDDRMSAYSRWYTVRVLVDILANKGAKELERVRIFTHEAPYYELWITLTDMGWEDTKVDVVMMERCPYSTGTNKYRPPVNLIRINISFRREPPKTEKS